MCESALCVNQTRSHCINQMRKTQSKPLAKRHGRGTAWEWHGMCESALSIQVRQFPVKDFDITRVSFASYLAEKLHLLTSGSGIRKVEGYGR
jgi:hypothetical protein